MSRNTPKIQSVFIYLASTVAYYVMGLIGLELSIPPGFASAVWPAAGVALAMMVLLRHNGVIAGVFTASFLLNLQVVSVNVSELDALSLLIPFTIACGAALQLLAGYCLFKYYLGKSVILDVAHTIIRFSLIVAPVGCLVSASIGTITLLAMNVITADLGVFSWLTWWLGDAIGTLLFTPMLIVMFAKNSQFQFSRKLEVIGPCVLIFVCACMLFFWSIENSNDNVIRELDDKTKYYIEEIDDQFVLSKNKLQSYQAFFQASDYISFKEFDSYFKKLLENDYSLFGVGWTEKVEHENRINKEKEIQQQGYPDFKFTMPLNGEMVAVKDKQYYYPVLYIYPYSSNKKALGLDLSMLSGRLDILEKIQKTGSGHVTNPITLVQENEDEKSIIMYLPVWGKWPNNSVISGYVSGVFRASGILGSIVEDAKYNNIGISILDVTDESSPEVLIDQPISKHAYLSPVNKNIVFLGRDYQITFSPSVNYKIEDKDWVSWIILISGFLISALLQAFILMMSGTIENTNKEVARKTKQLTKAIERSEEAIEKVESANKAKSLFLANMNHELRTPLNAIIGLINLCLKTPLSDKQSHYLDQSKLATHTLMALINQSLDYAKIESGKLELEEIEFDIAKVIQKTYAVFNTQAQQKEIEFILTIDDNIPHYVIGDALRLEQILLNICSNALKFTEVGSVALNISSQTFAQTTEEITFKIKDSGIGISKEQQARLFQSFHQADNTTTRKYGGTGLGLAISKQLVELMDGRIAINSELGSGCEFVISIPFKRHKRDINFNNESIIHVHNNVEMDASIESSHHNSLEGVRVLLVEDIEINRMIAAELLQNHGAQVTQAVNGQDALDILATSDHVDVVLMDIQMPVMDGYEAAKALRSQPQFDDLPILAMTANAMNEDIQRCTDAGMDAHIAKPIDEANMLTTISTALSKLKPQ